MHMTPFGAVVISHLNVLSPFFQSYFLIPSSTPLVTCTHTSVSSPKATYSYNQFRLPQILRVLSIRVTSELDAKHI